MLYEVITQLGQGNAAETRAEADGADGAGFGAAAADDAVTGQAARPDQYDLRPRLGRPAAEQEIASRQGGGLHGRAWSVMDGKRILGSARRLRQGG